jgi:hypothetical protein
MGNWRAAAIPWEVRLLKQRNITGSWRGGPSWSIDVETQSRS